MKTFLIAMCALMIGVSAPAFAADAPAGKGKLVHLVAFKYKKAITDEKKKEVADALVALKGKIPQIKSVDWGTNVSKEGFDKGFHQAFVITFANEKDRDTYLEHPEHKKFAKLLEGIIADKGVFVFDFVSKE
jgi:hypothetical protein